MIILIEGQLIQTINLQRIRTICQKSRNHFIKLFLNCLSEQLLFFLFWVNGYINLPSKVKIQSKKPQNNIRINHIKKSSRISTIKRLMYSNN